MICAGINVDMYKAIEILKSRYIASVHIQICEIMKLKLKLFL